MDQGACCLAQMLKGRNVARNEAGNDAPDGETQDQGAGAEQNGDNAGACIYVSDCATAFMTVPRVFITKNPACRTRLGQCGIEVAAFHLADASAARLEERRSEDRMSVSCSPSDPVLIADAADLSVCEIYLDHIFR
jgi:hypothetical protein